MTLPKRLSTMSPASIGSEAAQFGSSTGSGAWPAANRAYFVPLRLWRPMTVSQLWWVNGTTLTNNADAGIYDVNGNRLVSLGSTARSGSAARQLVSASLSLSRGLYYLALACAGNTGTFQRYAFPNIGTQRASGCLMMDSAFPLPDPVTFAALDSSLYIPLVGVDFA